MKNDQTYISNIFKFVTPEQKYEDKLVSYTQLALYNTCPKAWYINYVKKIKDDKPSLTLVYGTAMHNVIQGLIKDLYIKGATYCKNINYLDKFKQCLKDEYKANVEKYKIQFSTPEELIEYYYDGCEIIEYLLKKRSYYFSLKGMKLVGIEVPIYYEVDPKQPNIKLMAYLDLVFYYPDIKKYHIIDLKTSRSGWKDWDKKNKIKTGQLLMYKNYFSKQYNIPIDKITAEFIILRQKINPDSLWPQKRIQVFEPSSGPRLIKDVEKNVVEFIESCFSDGKYIDNPDKYEANQGKLGWNCTFCPYKDMHELCHPDSRK